MFEGKVGKINFESKKLSEPAMANICSPQKSPRNKLKKHAQVIFTYLGKCMTDLKLDHYDSVN